MVNGLSKSGGTVRTFIAVELPASVRQALASAAQPLATQRGALKLVAPNLLHITLRFLGNIPADRVPAVDAAARSAAGAARPFSLRLGPLGAFPNERSPRVIWVGLEKGPGLETLQALAGGLEEALAHVGFPHEARAFSPHITLARVREGLPPPERRAVADLLARTKGDWRATGEWSVRELTVMRSDLRPDGPRYTPIALAPLGGQAAPVP